MRLELTVLGSGTSVGVPTIGCRCAVCLSDDPHDKRTRPSILLRYNGHAVVIDTGPDFRFQALRAGMDRLDAILFTHDHADHVNGMDDLRRFCDLLGGVALTVYTTDEGRRRVTAMYPYAMAERPVAKGYAAFKLVDLPPVLELPQGTIHSTPLPHGGVNTLGLVFTERRSGKKFVYYTDCKSVPREAITLAQGADAVVLDGLRVQPHPSHMSIGEAAAVAREIGAPQTWLTHLTHSTDHGPAEVGLPAGVRFAYDGLRLSL